VIDREGQILYRHVGAVDARVWRETLAPMIQSLAGAGSG
jgi:cytochrome c biogenesis protein CcmG/thiol:disulfide interchange protein DsbE